MSIKVLVADDSITIQKVIGIIFGGDEYSLTVVDNGKAAVDKAREIIPDILLIDALMPGMTGYEVAEAVRLTPSLAAKPILILTGSFEPFDEEKSKKSGADDFIAKPFESQQIISKVKELLELGRSREQSAQALDTQPASETLHEQPLEGSAPTFGAQSQGNAQQTIVPQQAAPADIWDAFTPEVEPQAEADVASAVSAASAALEPDVFAIVNEENNAHLVKTAVAAETSPDHTGSQWVPVEENTFEFEEENITESHLSTFAERAVPVQEAAFGDISFKDEVATPAAPFVPLVDPAPAFAAPVEPVPASLAIDAAVPATLTEEQLKAILASASKEVIERIVWEVVPDLADVLIREAIRKIKEGV